MSVKIELEKDETKIIYNSLIRTNNFLVNEIKTMKKNKIKYGLEENENHLKKIRKLINFFDKL